jgi:biofilm protein TabA
MIVDKLYSYQHLTSLHPGFDQAFAFLQNAYELGIEQGRHVLVPDRLWVVVEQVNGRSMSGARLEAHRRLIDIQLGLRGNERIGWLPLEDCGEPNEPYCAERDIAFFADRPSTWIDLVPGQFAIFFPRDAHAPLAGSGEVVKAIAKVAVDW